MGTKFLQLKENICKTVWFVPLCIVFGFILLASLLVQIEGHLPKAYFSKEKLDTVLSYLATSLITVLTIIFSVTVLMLSLAANMLGPRLIPNFIKRWETKYMIGLTLGAFCFSLVVLLSASSSFLSLLAFTISVLTLFFLLYFIHFVCCYMQVESVLDELLQNIKRMVEREYPAHAKNSESFDSSGIVCYVVTSKKNGYVQSIDYETIFTLAHDNDVVVEIVATPGDYLVSGQTLCYLYGNDTICQKIHEQFSIGTTRSNVQDITFLFEEIVEIIIRAMSPGVNNPYTAVTCIHYLAEAIQALANKRCLLPVWKKSGKMYVVTPKMTAEKVLNSFFSRLRLEVKKDLYVSEVLISMINTVVENISDDACKKCLEEHVRLLVSDALSNIENSTDKEKILQLRKS